MRAGKARTETKDTFYKEEKSVFLSLFQKPAAVHNLDLKEQKVFSSCPASDMRLRNNIAKKLLDVKQISPVDNSIPTTEPPLSTAKLQR